MFSLQNSGVNSGNTAVATVLATAVLPCQKLQLKTPVNLRQQGRCHPVVRPMATHPPLYKRGGVVGEGFLKTMWGVLSGACAHRRRIICCPCLSPAVRSPFWLEDLIGTEP
jgi:hypothetical protein